MKDNELNAVVTVVPKASPTSDKSLIIDIIVKVGQKVKKGEVLFQIQTDKATVDVESDKEGIVGALFIEKDKEYGIAYPAVFITEKGKNDPRIQDVLDHIKDQNKEPIEEVIVSEKETKVKRVASITQEMFPFTPTGEIDEDMSHDTSTSFASPKAKKLANELGVAISTVKGTGPQGRVLAQDIVKGQRMSYIELSSFSKAKPGSFEYEEMSPIRSMIGSRLQASKQQIPHFYLSIDVEMDRLVECRKSLVSTYGIKVSINDFVVRASALALRKHMNLNVGYDNQEEKIIAFKTVDIAIAVAVDTGLITPIVHKADQRSIIELSSVVRALVGKARKGKLLSHEYQGGSFTISNLGMMGIKDFCAIINPPQAAILAVGCLQEYVKLEHGVCRNCHKTTFTLSCDHRIIDGAEGAQFLQTFKKLLESPEGLLISVA